MTELDDTTRYVADGHSRDVSQIGHAVGNPISKLHAHRRAQRYMEKRLLRDLWQEWRKVCGQGQQAIDNQSLCAESAPVSCDEGQKSHSTHDRSADIAGFILEIKETHRHRQDLKLAEGNLTRQIKAICRRLCGGDKKSAEAMYKNMDEVALGACLVHLQQRDSFTKAIKPIEKRLKELVKNLPVWRWVETINGFGAIGFAQIVAEAGDLNNYANPAKLWKRFGLAPYRGSAPSTWRVCGGLSKQEWKDAGYSPRRRSIMFVIGDSLIKKQNTYRDIYLTRKASEIHKQT